MHSVLLTLLSVQILTVSYLVLVVCFRLSSISHYKLSTLKLVVLLPTYEVSSVGRFSSGVIKL